MTITCLHGNNSLLLSAAAAVDQNKLTFFLFGSFQKLSFTPDLFDVFKWKMFCNFVLKTINLHFGVQLACFSSTVRP